MESRPMDVRRTPAAGLALAGVALTLSACGGGGTSSTSPKASTAPATTTPNATAAVPADCAPATGKAVKGTYTKASDGVLVFKNDKRKVDLAVHVVSTHMASSVSLKTGHRTVKPTDGHAFVLVRFRAHNNGSGAVKPLALVNNVLAVRDGKGTVYRRSQKCG